MFCKFKFEKKFDSIIEPIPLSTQYRLDNIGVVIRTETWNKLSKESRMLFDHFPVKTDEDKECFRRYLLYLLKRIKRTVQVLDDDQVNRANAQWQDFARIPQQVYQAVVDLDYTLSPRDWIKLSDFKRFVMVKLSQGNHSRGLLNEAFMEILGTESKVTAWKSKSENYSESLNQLVS